MPDPDPAARIAALEAALAAAAERAARTAEDVTVALGDYDVADRVAFAVANMERLRTAIAAALRAGG